MIAAYPGVEVHHCPWERLAEIAELRSSPLVDARGGIDALITDAPYSARTHAGHDRGTRTTNEGGADGAERRELDYPPWSAADVDRFVDRWAPLVRGWFVSITDDALAPAWRAALERHDRLSFQPLPCVIRGMTVRQRGDGPSSWATYAIVARPRNAEFARWGTLPGAYVGPREACEVVGGKPLWLLDAIVGDYTRPGDLVVDPCCGSGTTLAAALRRGRLAIGGDVDREHAEIAARRVAPSPQLGLFRAEGGA